MLNKYEKIIQKNIKASKGSFIYTFHNDDIFNEEYFFELVDSITKKDIINSKEEHLQLINIFLYVLKTFVYHFDKSDSSEILNFNVIQDKLACYVELSEYCILCISTSSKISLDHVKNIINEYIN